ncbi:PREDICTED: glycine, alanine and asparagine-rich protein-like isoform X2 [Priapulus caudatus]|uniref:Glycine, alanine and asparagine-rich protein-like isoform X2 n=1 Tax=Priapulus caudatus TaxID=37621 RepID=A0ABM1ELC9_PRICU|nr:PREDICTED: glycine, alanine and asparagine-rich protein-like isoform X2 [Priapulus caudatus]
MKIFVSAILLACVAQAMCGSYRQGGGGRGGGGGGGGFRTGGAQVRQVVSGGAGRVGGFSAGGARVGGFSAGGARVGGFSAGGARGGGFSAGGARGGSFGGGSISSGISSGFGMAQGGNIDPNNFANIDASAFGFDNFGNTYINVEAFDFNNWRNAAQALAPREAINAAQTEQIVIGRRFRSGSARQTETSSASKEGSGNGEAGIELSASRTASQDATQQFKQQASGDGSTSQGATYGFERNNNGQIRFAPVKLDSLPVHSGPRSQVPQPMRKSYQKW